MPSHATRSPLHAAPRAAPTRTDSPRLAPAGAAAAPTFATLEQAAALGHRFDRIAVGGPAPSGAPAVIQCFRNRLTGRDEEIRDVPSSHLEDHATRPDFHRLSESERGEVDTEVERRAFHGIHVSSQEEERERTRQSGVIDLTPMNGLRPPRLQPQFPPTRYSSHAPSYPSSAAVQQPPYQPHPTQPQTYPRGDLRATSSSAPRFPPTRYSSHAPSYPSTAPVHQPHHQPYSMQPQSYPPGAMPSSASTGSSPYSSHASPQPSPVEAYKKAYQQARFIHTTNKDNLEGILNEGLDPKYAGTAKGMTYMRNPDDEEFIRDAKNTGVHLFHGPAKDATYGSYLASKKKTPSALRVFLDRDQVAATGKDPQDRTATGYRALIPPTAIKPVLEDDRPERTPAAQAQARQARFRIIGSHLDRPLSDAELSTLHKQASDSGAISDDDD